MFAADSSYRITSEYIPDRNCLWDTIVYYLEGGIITTRGLQTDNVSKKISKLFFIFTSLTLQPKINRLPTREEVPVVCEISSVVEYYAR